MLILRGQCVLLAGPAARPSPPSMRSPSAALRADIAA